MFYQTLADIVVVVHLGWILFLIFGAIPGRRWRWVRWLHLGALAFSVALQSCSWICPLTYLEVWLRALAGNVEAYHSGFITHYAERLVYARLPRRAELGATIIIGVASLWAYFAPRR